MTSERLAGFDAAPGNAGRYGPDAAFDPATPKIVGFVGVQLDRSPAWPYPPASNAGNGIQRRGKHHAVMAVGAAEGQTERHAGPIEHKGSCPEAWCS